MFCSEINNDLVVQYKGFKSYTTRLRRLGALDGVYVDLAGVNTAEDKFMITHCLLEKYNILPKILRSSNLQQDSGIAKDIRVKGNIYFMEKKFFLAIDKYTESLMLCEPGSEYWAYALANRSAALFYTKYYHNCLKDIGQALKSRYPARLTYKLYKRAGHAERLLGHEDLAKHNYNECLKHLEKASMSDDKKKMHQVEIVNSIEMCRNLITEMEFEENTIINEVLFGGKNEVIPALSNYLELKCTANMGRGVFATRDINPGDVVAIDEPYIYGPFHGVNHVCYLNNCLKLSIAVLPCSKCLTAVYCDEKCMQKDFDEHHRICSVIRYIKNTPGNRKVNELVIKWFLKEYSQMGLDKFYSVLDQLSKTKTVPITRGLDDNGLYKSDNFMTAYTLDIGENRFSRDVLFFFNCVGAELLQYLMLSGFEIPKSYLPTIGASFVHMLKVLDVNCFKLNLYGPAVKYETKNTKFSVTGLALYPSICLFNHSCDANVMRSGLLSDKKRILKAVQPIPKGNQLFISYGCYYKMSDTNARKRFCHNIFRCECYCQPCQQNWPVKRFFPNRLSMNNILNPDDDMNQILVTECDKFIELKNSIGVEDLGPHLNYLYYFLKLLFTNVKRPFALYEECLEMICEAHLLFNDKETDIARKLSYELQWWNF